MNGAPVFYDTWAWMETAYGGTLGRQLMARYGPDGPATLHTSFVAVAEAGSAAARSPSGGPNAAKQVMTSIERRAKLHPLTLEDVHAAIPLHVQLRKHANASLADALMLAQAKRLGFPFITGDRAFRGMPGVPQDWIPKD